MDQALAGRTGRGGAGNTISTSSNSQQAAKQILKEEKKVLQHYKKHTSADHKTGRGGAGAKGHIKVRGMVPNQERALEKERYVQMKWRMEKEVNGSMRTGRGGQGNIKKAKADGTLTSLSKASNLDERVESQFGPAMLGMVTMPSGLHPFADLDAPIDQRSKRLSAQQVSSVHSNSFSTSYDTSRSPKTCDDNWDQHTVAETVYDFETGMVTTVADPSTVLRSASRLAASATPGRVPTEVAPFEEPISSGLWEDAPLPPARPRETISSAIDKRPASLFKAFRNLNIGKAKDQKRENVSETPDITVHTSRQSSDPSSSLDTFSTTPQHVEASTTPSVALGMISPSNRHPLFPPRVIGQTIISLTEGIDLCRSPSRSSEKGEVEMHLRGRAGSNASFVSVSSGHSLVLAPPPTHKPPSRPASRIDQAVEVISADPQRSEHTVVPKGVVAPRRSRPLPVPPVASHAILCPPFSPTPSPPSPPETSLHVGHAQDMKSSLPTMHSAK